MLRVVYVSEATRRLTKPQVDQIVETSRRNNSKADLTGMLIYHEHRFFQVLEGPLAAVQKCMDRIQLDPRHTGTVIIEQGSAVRRSFPSWRMGYSNPAELDPELRKNVFKIYDLIPRNSTERGDDEQVRNHVRHFLAGFEKFQSA